MGNTTIHNQYFRLQLEAGLTNSQAADFLGKDLATIKRYRNGKLTPPPAIIKLLKYKIKFGEI